MLSEYKNGIYLTLSPLANDMILHGRFRAIEFVS